MICRTESWLYFVVGAVMGAAARANSRRARICDVLRVPRVNAVVAFAADAFYPDGKLRARLSLPAILTPECCFGFMRQGWRP